MIKNYDQTVKINHNPNWVYIPDDPYRIVIIGGRGSVKINVSLKLMKDQRLDIDKICICFKGPFESKYELLFNGREKVVIKKLKNPEAFIDY